MKTIWVYMMLVFTVMVGISLAAPLCEVLVRHPELDGDLEITAEQREKMEDLFENTEKQIIESTGKMRIKRLEMDRAMRSEDPDMREIRKLVNEIGDARSASMLARIERNLKMREILGDERMGRARKMAMMMGRQRDLRHAERGMMGRWERGMQGRPGRSPMMQGRGEMGMAGGGCRGKMMQSHGKMGMAGGGCHGKMMQGHGEKGMHGEGCHGKMMKGHGEKSMYGEGCHGKMMKGHGEKGMHGEGCHGKMMKESGDSQ